MKKLSLFFFLFFVFLEGLAQTDLETLKSKYDVVLEINQTAFAVKKNSQWGLVNKQGKLLFPLQFDSISVFPNHKIPFFKNRYCVMKSNKWGFINAKGKIVVPIKYDFIQPSIYPDKVYVQIEQEYYFINKNGKKVI